MNIIASVIAAILTFSSATILKEKSAAAPAVEKKEILPQEPVMCVPGMAKGKKKTELVAENANEFRSYSCEAEL